MKREAIMSRLIEAYEKTGSRRAAARMCGIPPTTANEWLSGVERKSVNRGLILCENDIFRNCDAESRYIAGLRRVLGQLGRGEYMRENDARREAGAMGNSDLWRKVRAMDEFRRHVLEVGFGSKARVYFGHADSVAELIRSGRAHRPVWAMDEKEAVHEKAERTERV